MSQHVYPSLAERQVADLLPIDVDPALALATVEAVPFWFHTFALNRAEGIYTPGAARDHRYRISTLPNDFGGMSVLDVGTFDGFYAFLAEHRGADRVVAVDNEQYRLWVASRWGVELEGGEGFRAIHRLLGSAVEYRRMDAFELDGLDERFDLVYCLRHPPPSREPARAAARAAWADGERRHRAGRDLRRPPGRSRRALDPRRGAR